MCVLEWDHQRLELERMDDSKAHQSQKILKSRKIIRLEGFNGQKLVRLKYITQSRTVVKAEV